MNFYLISTHFEDKTSILNKYHTDFILTFDILTTVIINPPPLGRIKIKKDYIIIAKILFTKKLASSFKY